MTDHRSPPPLSIWTRLAVEPVANPLARLVSRWGPATPNRVTIGAGLLGIAAAGSFVAGWLVAGGLLFLLRYVLDCVDGKVARLRGLSSTRGAALDIHVDVAGISLCAGALVFHLVDRGGLPVWVALSVMGALTIYNFGLAYRKDLARQAGRGSGGSAHEWTAGGPFGGWLRWCRRMNMMPFPWTADVETVVFGLAPMFLPVSWLWVVLLGGVAFYLLATAVNMRRVWSIAAHLDQQRSTLFSHQDSAITAPTTTTGPTPPNAPTEVTHDDSTE